MSDADELVRVLRANGLGPWMTDDLGRSVRVADWAGDFVDNVNEVLGEENAEEAERLAELRTALDDNPTQKSITVKRLRAIIDPQR
jgi:hypothetical protein